MNASKRQTMQVLHTRVIYLRINAAVNRHLELTLLKVREIFDAISTSNLEVHKFGDWWILTYFIFGVGVSSLIILKHSESWTNVSVVALLFSLFEGESWPRKKQISLLNLHPTLFSRWWILTQLFWKRGELMVNFDLTIMLKRWTEMKAWGG